jgi:hypothetical protein
MRCRGARELVHVVARFQPGGGPSRRLDAAEQFRSPSYSTSRSAPRCSCTARVIRPRTGGIQLEGGADRSGSPDAGECRARPRRGPQALDERSTMRSSSSASARSPAPCARSPATASAGLPRRFSRNSRCSCSTCSLPLLRAASTSSRAARAALLFLSACSLAWPGLLAFAPASRASAVLAACSSASPRAARPRSGGRRCAARAAPWPG